MVLAAVAALEQKVVMVMMLKVAMEVLELHQLSAAQ
jgi:hypothetical protein